MSIVTACPNPNNIVTSFDATTLLVDASGEKAAFIIKIARTGTLNKIGFRTGAMVQTQNVRVSFQDVSTSTGVPDDTTDQFRDVSVGDTDDNVWKETGLITSDGTDTGTKRSVTKGDFIAVVFEQASFNSGDILRVSATSQNLGDYYCALKTSGSWAKISLCPNLALYYDDGAGGSSVYYIGALSCVTTATTQAFNSGSSPNKRGLKFKFETAVYTTGVQALLIGGSSNDCQFKLYDASGTLLQTSATNDGDITRGSTRVFTYYWPTDQLLAANTYYHIMIEPTTVASMTFNYIEVNAAALFDQMDGGQSFHYVDNSGAAGAFVALTTRRPYIIVNHYPAPSGGASIFSSVIKAA